MNTVSDADMAEARDYLRGILREGQTLYTTAEGAGQTHYVNVYIAELRDGEPAIRRITHHVAKALGQTISPNRRYGIAQGGGGYSKEFNVVYNLGRVLHDYGPLRDAGYTYSQQSLA